MTHPLTRQNDSAPDTGLSCAAPGRPERRRAIAAGLSLIGGGLLTAGLARPALAAVSADGVLARAERALGSARVKSIRFAGTGTGSTFGQAFEPGGAWPKLTISAFSRVMDYPAAAMREDSARARSEVNGGGAVPLMGTGEQRISAFLNETYAWNMAGQTPAAAPVALEARQHDLWTSPHGVLIAARRNKATVDFKTEAGKSLAAVSFTEPGVMAAVAYINGDGLVERVEARIPHPVTGDTLVVTRYTDYRAYGGAMFPARIVQSHFGQPTLDIEVKEVEINPATGFVAPDAVRAFAEKVASTQAAEGVWFLAGGSHNSVVIEMKDHVVVVETPLYDGRSAAVLAEARRLVPGKPIRTVINSHHHFDHSGGLRTAVAEGAQLMVAAAAKPFFEKVLANPNRIKPDLLAKSGKRAKIVGYSGKTVLSDGSRQLEVHAIESSVHSKGFNLVYLPKERLLIEADAFTPGAPDAAPPAKPNANNVNLAENIDRLKLSVDRILPLHGRIVPLSELHRMIGRKA